MKRHPLLQAPARLLDGRVAERCAPLGEKQGLAGIKRPACPLRTLEYRVPPQLSEEGYGHIDSASFAALQSHLLWTQSHATCGFARQIGAAHRIEDILHRKCPQLLTAKSSLHA